MFGKKLTNEEIKERYMFMVNHFGITKEKSFELEDNIKKAEFNVSMKDCPFSPKHKVSMIDLIDEVLPHIDKVE